MKVSKYRMFIQARTDLTEDEIRRYESCKRKNWPWRDTGDFVYARRTRNAKDFYRALHKIRPLIKLKAEYVSCREAKNGRTDDVAMRAWRQFPGVMGTIVGAADEVRHFDVGGVTACGLVFSESWPSNGKPECPKCLEAAVKQHPRMKEYL